MVFESVNTECVSPAMENSISDRHSPSNPNPKKRLLRVMHIFIKDRFDKTTHCTIVYSGIIQHVLDNGHSNTNNRFIMVYTISYKLL